ncbi:hypothetical protein OG455_41590 [Kitasatospora sp. NBC_01287]|uniref:hypothetical protein n=1 Tax=Kitasatospora sp. NBC_01287 TaxID=2903573 RepID=UPI002256E3D0|nr:hypothetical protein [Kitasatospora sp. NBC_01287]MCX4750978.1 hypothetical protein [Kitasatospora sp. NBC_01287]MCX4751771.1 hypothetical protein [Kitasatospora sp. NBC_01287]MCX4751937.1 hypothetical protein [Kitasatospora sp. NBC_01287]
MTLTPRQINQRLALHDQLLNILTEAQQERPERQEVFNGELDWVTFERTVMLNAVNAARAAQLLPPIPISAVEAVEQQAIGHSDYSTKFALYCVELALEQA